MDSAAWGLLGTVVGAVASIVTTWLTTRNATNLELKRAREDRSERARAFQQDTLTNLEDAIHDALRLMARAHIETDKAATRGVHWDKVILPDEIDEGFRLATRKVTLLVDRVSDDTLRYQVKLLMQIGTRVILARNKDESEVAMAQASEASPPVFERIGVLLRQHLHTEFDPK